MALRKEPHPELVEGPTIELPSNAIALPSRGRVRVGGEIAQTLEIIARCPQP
jgi:hypothetical protein